MENIIQFDKLKKFSTIFERFHIFVIWIYSKPTSCENGQRKRKNLCYINTSWNVYHVCFGIKMLPKFNLILEQILLGLHTSLSRILTSDAGHIGIVLFLLPYIHQHQQKETKANLTAFLYVSLWS